MDFNTMLDLLKNGLQENWGMLLCTWVVSQIVNYQLIAKLIVNIVKKMPVWIRKPLLILLDKLAKAIDSEIEDEPGE